MPPFSSICVGCGAPVQYEQWAEWADTWPDSIEIRLAEIAATLANLERLVQQQHDVRHDITQLRLDFDLKRAGPYQQRHIRIDLAHHFGQFQLHCFADPRQASLPRE